MGAVPTYMSACRALLACVALNHSEVEVLQSDCRRAYVRVAFTGPPTYIELPREWWPKAWQGMRRPVCRLKKALYGKPKAGDLWAVILFSVLKQRTSLQLSFTVLQRQRCWSYADRRLCW